MLSSFFSFYKNTPFYEVHAVTVRSTYTTVYSLRMCDDIPAEHRTRSTMIDICVFGFKSVLFRLSLDIPYQCNVCRLFFQCVRPMKRVQVCKIPKGSEA